MHSFLTTETRFLLFLSVYTFTMLHKIEHIITRAINLAKNDVNSSIRFIYIVRRCIVSFHKVGKVYFYRL